jgi:hypothetical protein
MNVCNKLLTALKISGIDASAAVVFFGTQVRCMMHCKPNYGPHRKVPSGTFRFNTYILKGYYPGTPTVFRVTLIHDVSHTVSDANYFAKVTMPNIILNNKLVNKSVRFSSDTIDKYIAGVAETEIFGTEPPPIVEVNKLNIPKCISPRGMPVYKLNRDRNNK